jgi:hypothetical protein
MKFKTILILLFCFQYSIAEKLDLKSDSSDYLIGEHAKLTLSYDGVNDFLWPILEDTLTKDLEIVEIGNIDTIAKGKYQQKITITAWDSGYFVIPPIQTQDIQTQPLLVRFNTLQIDTQKNIKPIKEQMDTPFIFTEIKELVFWIIITVIILTSLTIFILYLIKKNKNKIINIPPEPTRPIMDLLWERYYSLEQSKIWEKEGEKEFQFELSLILRSFLEFKYNIKALEETTKNIALQLTSLGIDAKLREDVLHILNFSDMVKFAKQKGVYSQHENALSILKKILETQIIKVG